MCFCCVEESSERNETGFWLSFYCQEKQHYGKIAEVKKLKKIRGYAGEVLATPSIKN